MRNVISKLLTRKLDQTQSYRCKAASHCELKSASSSCGEKNSTRDTEYQMQYHAGDEAQSSENAKYPVKHFYHESPPFWKRCKLCLYRGDPEETIRQPVKQLL